MLTCCYNVLTRSFVRGFYCIEVHADGRIFVNNRVNVTGVVPI